MPLGGAAPLKAVLDEHTEDDIKVTRALEAWEWLRGNERLSWDKWKVLGEGLLVGRHWAMNAAHTNTPQGRKYSNHFHEWCVDTGFGELDKDDRAKLLVLMTHLDEVEAWRASRPESERMRYNHPTTIWRVSKCRTRGIQATREEEHTKVEEEPINTPPKADPEADEETQNEVERRLLAVAEEIIDKLLLRRWPLPGTVSPGVVQRWRQVSQAVAQFVDHLAKAR
jgi:hypothetical protein